MDESDTEAVLKFEHELRNVFNRWYHESDLDDMDLARGAIRVIQAFCGSDTVHFESDIDLGEDDEYEDGYEEFFSDDEC